MRLLAITNFYPPVGLGGYEQWCQEVAHGLRDRGNDLLILTSTYKRNDLQEPDPPWVYRELHLEMEFASLRNAIQFFTARKRREGENLRRLQEIINYFSPDAVIIWGMWNLSLSLPAMAEKLMPGRVAYYMGDYWPTLPSQFENYWNAPPRNFTTGIPKLLLKPIAQGMLAREERPALLLDHIMFPSKFLQTEFERRGIFPRNPKIVYGAIDTKPYLNVNFRLEQHDKISLLYIGRLTYDKGVHTAIEALGNIVWEHSFKNLKLTVVGDGDPKYVTRLHELVERKNITSYVNFLPAQPKEAIPALYHQSDIFLFTSIWAEPFGRVIIEAMVSGLAVVGTAVGGAAEILIEEENALMFQPDNPDSLSHQLKRLIESPSLREKLGNIGRKYALSRFDINRMTDEIVEYLQTHILGDNGFQ